MASKQRARQERRGLGYILHAAVAAAATLHRLWSTTRQATIKAAPRATVDRVSGLEAVPLVICNWPCAWQASEAVARVWVCATLTHSSTTCDLKQSEARTARYQALV